MYQHTVFRAYLTGTGRDAYLDLGKTEILIAQMTQMNNLYGFFCNTPVERIPEVEGGDTDPKMQPHAVDPSP